MVTGEIDLHAAGSLWFGRATLVKEFTVGPWKAVILAADPRDAESVLGRLACEVSEAGRFRGVIWVRTRSPQLQGGILTSRHEITVETPEFSGGAVELEAAVRRELTALSTK